MPRRGHSSGQRAGSGQSDSKSGSDSSESDSEAGQQHPPAGQGIRRVPRIVQVPAAARVVTVVSPQVECPGCGQKFPSMHSLKLHRNSSRLANASCRAAARAMKRPLSVPRAAGEADGFGQGDSDHDAGDEIDRMLGNRALNQSVAPGGAPDRSSYPRHGDAVSGLNICMEKGSNHH
jgi:hypothetical protein